MNLSKFSQSNVYAIQTSINNQNFIIMISYNKLYMCICVGESYSKPKSVDAVRKIWISISRKFG